MYLNLMFLMQELFVGSKYKIKNENDTYQLIIMAPKVEDAGKYTIEIAGVSSTAFLNVDGKKADQSIVYLSRVGIGEKERSIFIFSKSLFTSKIFSSLKMSFIPFQNLLHPILSLSLF